jgi:FkbH-like protein
MRFFLRMLISQAPVLVLPLASSFLIAVALGLSGVAQRLTPTAWLALAPVLYCAWLIVHLSLSALLIQVLFRSSAKLRHTVFKLGDREEMRNTPDLICYSLGVLVRALPLTNVISLLPGLQKLFLLAYAPGCRVGKNVLLAGYLYDPDLTEIGDDVILGAGSVLSAHSAIFNPQGEYVIDRAPIRIGNRVTVGGEARIGLGVSIGDDAVVQAGSNVAPFSRIGPGEVWGGDPAVLLRKREAGPPREVDAAPKRPANSAGAACLAGPGADARREARRLVSQALNLPSGGLAEDQVLGADTSDAWDSLGQLAIAAMLHDAYGWQSTPGRIFQLRSVAEVERAILEARTAARPSPSGSPTRLPADPEWLPLLPSDVATRLLAQADPGFPSPTVSLPVVIAASFTAEPLAASLQRWGAAFGIDTRITFAGFNQVAQALLAPESPFRRHSDGLNVVLLRPEDFPESPQAAAEAARDLLDAIRQFARESGGLPSLVVGTLPPPLAPTFGGDRLEVDLLRADWARQLAEIEGVERFDFAGVIERTGLAAAGDVALEAAARAPYSAAVYRELGIELARLVRRRQRPPAKVLALDCDGVLWGGVLGEEGADGIQLGPDGPGRCFQLFQHALLRLRQRGVLLTLVSRNEEHDVFEVFDNHPGMVLRRDDIAAWRINWQPKSQNLRELADELNLGLDSFVFLDDDPAVRLHVETHLPQVHVFPTPAEPARFAEALSRLWLFDAPRLTAEDASRTVMLGQERLRRQERATVADLSSYLHGLQLRVAMREAQPRDLARVAQLTQKTNQFNLSLRRRTLEEIEGLDGDSRTYVVSACDRFGDYGQVGVCILRTQAEPDPRLEIDTFLLSCRALGRGVEEAMLHGVFEIARQDHLPVVHAPFVEGPRNQPARSFFAGRGFRENEGRLFEAGLVPGCPLPAHVSFQLEAGGRLTSRAAPQRPPQDGRAGYALAGAHG